MHQVTMGKEDNALQFSTRVSLTTGFPSLQHVVALDRQFHLKLFGINTDTHREIGL
jgi:hypothetical protein